MGSSTQNTVVVRTSEYFGDGEMVLSFPAGWQVAERRMDGHSAPPLSDDEITAALRNTIDTPNIQELAAGKGSVVITFDDLARPTPTDRVVPFILQELHKAGITDEQIIFQCAPGTHAPLYQQDMVAKLGADIVANYPVWNHDCHSGLTPVGTTSRGNDVRLNPRFVAADLKICISGVKPHGMAGYGGGAKQVVPGLAWIKTAFHIHEVINPASETAVGFLNNEVRLDVEEAARMVGLDMSVNIVMNGDRKVAGLFAGDVVSAHRKAVVVAHQFGNTEPVESPDIVICNAYPQSVEANKELDMARKTLKDGGSAVLIADTPAGQRKMHYLGWINNGGGDRRRPASGLPVSQAGQVIIFNRYPAFWDEMEYSTDVCFAKTWDEVIALLKSAHSGEPSVAVYPTAPFQHLPMELRM